MMGDHDAVRICTVPRWPVSFRTLTLSFFGSMTTRQIDCVCETLDKVLEKRLMTKKTRF